MAGFLDEMIKVFVEDLKSLHDGMANASMNKIRQNAATRNISHSL